jgi:hypothetical protein
MLKIAFAAALLIGAASASQAQTFKVKGATLDLTSGGNGTYTGTYTPKGGSAFDALGFSSSYIKKDTLTVSSVDTAKGSDYDVVYVLEGAAAASHKSGDYIEYYEQLTSKKFKMIGSGKWHK